MSVQRLVTQGGRVSYRARVKSHGREVATKSSIAGRTRWLGSTIRHGAFGSATGSTPRRGRVSLAMVADGWLDSRASVKRRTRETDLATWANYVKPTFGNRAIGRSPPPRFRSGWRVSLPAVLRQVQRVGRSLSSGDPRSCDRG